MILDRAKGAWKSLRALVLKDAVEGELSDELAFHVEMETRKNEAEGMSPAEARRAALVAFRGVERYKEEVRAVRRTQWIESLARDLGAAVRMIRRSPGLAVVVILTLGLGIGATTAIFSVVDTAVLQPLPWSDPDALTLVRETTPQGMAFTVSAPNYLDFSERARSFSGLAAFREIKPSLTGSGEPERLDGLAVTHTFFPVLGAAAEIGRTFRVEEDQPGGDGRVVVLSHGLWQGRFGADSAVVGSRITLDGERYLVAGVMPSDFESFDAELWLPLAPDAAADRQNHWLDVIGRLAPGATREQAESELTRISASLGETHPAMAGWSVEVRDLKAALVGPDFRRASLVLAVAVALLLLMACLNVANLLLAHATARRGDLGIRAALGAGRVRLARQLLTESAVLGLAGAAVGLLGAWWTVSAVRAAAPAAIPRVEDLAVDLRVLAFAAAIGILTTVLSGFLPALQAGRTDAAAQLRSGARGGVTRRNRRLREGLVMAQVALAVVLLLAAGVMVRSFVRLQAVDPGFRTADILAVPLSLPQSRYGDEFQRFLTYREILDGVGSIPGVESAAAAFVDPFSGMNLSNDVTPEELAGAVTESGYMLARWRIVTPNWFETLGVPLLQGRLFTTEDRYGNAPTVIITRTLAEGLWPGEDAVGKRLFWGGTDGDPRTVVGVVGDVQDVALDADPPPLMFLSYQQLIMPAMTLMVRTRGEVPGLAAAVREAVWAVDPALPVTEVRPLAQNRAAAVAGPRFHTLVLSAFAAVALALAVVGLYGLLGFVVARRTREIGVRRALGAGSVAVSGMVVRRGVALAAAGVALGLLMAFGLNRFVETLLFRTDGSDPLVFLVTPALFLIVAAAASWIPARRAGRVSPMVALRAE